MQTYLEYKHIIESRMDIFVLDLFILCWQVKRLLIILVCFHLMMFFLKKWQDNSLLF